jgi:hypothetical protein
MILRKKIFFKNFILVASLAFGGLLAMEEGTGSAEESPFYASLKEFENSNKIGKRKIISNFPNKIPNTQAHLSSIFQSQENHLPLIDKSGHGNAIHETCADIMVEEIELAKEGFDSVYHATNNELYGRNKLATQAQKLNNELTGLDHLNPKIRLLLLRSNTPDSNDKKLRTSLKQEACTAVHDKNYLPPSFILELPPKNLSEAYLKLIAKIFPNHTGFDMNNGRGTHLLSCNMALTNNDKTPGESSLHYFVNNRNASYQKRNTKTCFEKGNSAIKYLEKQVPAMDKALQRFNNATASGTMLQIAIKDTGDRAMIDDLSFPAAPTGLNQYETIKKYHEDPHAIIINRPKNLEPLIQFCKKTSSLMDETERMSRLGRPTILEDQTQIRLIIDSISEDEDSKELKDGLLNINSPNIHNNVVMNAYTTTKTGEGIDAQKEFHKDVDHIMSKVKYDYQKEQRRDHWWNKAKNFILPAIKLPSTTIPDKPVNPHAYKPGMAITVPFWKKTFDYHKNKQMGMTEQYKPVETTNPFV